MGLMLQDNEAASVLEIEAFEVAKQLNVKQPVASISEVRLVEAGLKERLGLHFAVVVDDLAKEYPNTDPDVRIKAIGFLFRHSFAQKTGIDPFTLCFMMDYCAYKQYKSKPAPLDFNQFK